MSDQTLWRAHARLTTELKNMIPVCNHGLAAMLPLVWVEESVTLRQLLLAFLIGNLADIDSASSRIGRLIYPLAKWIELKFGHRTITHSLLAVALVALLARVAADYHLEPWAWWWWPIWYGSHLIVDMIINQSRGVPLLWPLNRLRFYLMRVKPGGSGEQIVFGLLLTMLVIGAIGVTFEPYRYLHEQAATLDFALEDIRKWEPFYTVYVEIEGTLQNQAHTPITGRFLVERVVGATLYLEAEGVTFTAGQLDEDVYLRAVVAVQGPERALPAVAVAILPTPALVKITIPQVYAPETELKVRAGDIITKQQLLADLVVYRAKLNEPTATPTPSRTATPMPTPTVTNTPNPYAVEHARVNLLIAQAQATAFVATKPQAMIVAQARVALAAGELQQAQAAYDPVSWRSDIGMLPEALNLEEATHRYAIAVAEATAAAQGPTDAERNIVLAQLHKAEVDFLYLVATLTPAPTATRPPGRVLIPTPTHPPTATPDLTYWDKELAEKTRIYSLVAGQVREVRVASIVGNVATMELWVQVDRNALGPGDLVTGPATTTAYPDVTTVLLLPTATASGNNKAAGEQANLPLPTVSPAPTPQPTATPPATTFALPLARVTQHVDGDTFKVSLIDTAGVTGLAVGEIYTLRLIGVDTPETKHPTKGVQCYGPEASAFTAQMAPINTLLNFDLDIQATDRYGRLLVYAYLPDGRMLNQLLVTHGYAQVATYPPNIRYVETFIHGQTIAREQEQGLWGNCQ